MRALKPRVGPFISDHWRGAVIFLSVLPLIVLAVLAILGLFFQPLSATAPKVLVNPSVVTATSDTTPGAAVLAELLGQASTMPSFAQRAWPKFAPDAGLLPVDPVGQTCAATAPLAPALSPVLSRSSLLTLLSATSAHSTPPAAAVAPPTVAVSASVVGPGLGMRVFEARQSQVSYCPGAHLVAIATTPTPQFIATLSVFGATSIVEFVAVKSDVLVTVVVSVPDGPTTRTVGQTALTYLVDQLTTSLAHVCADTQTSTSLATRNPTQPDYVAPTRLVTLAPPSTLTPPDPTLINAKPPTVAVPPVGTVTTAPTAPVIPTVALSVTISVPASDVTGPGCGWAFTGQVAAALPTTPLSAAQSALTGLEAEWSNWPVTVATYLRALANYHADLISYEHWQSTTTTSTSTTSTTTSTTIPTTSTSVPPSTTTSHP